MKIESPSSITPREASVRLEWISTRILPGVGVLLLSIPLCQWTDSVLPDGIVPIYVIYLLFATVLWSIYMAVQYAFVGITQTRKSQNSAQDSVHSNAFQNYTNINDPNVQHAALLLEAMPVIFEQESVAVVDEAEVVEEIVDAEVVEDTSMSEAEVSSKDNHTSSTYQQGIDDFYQSQAECQKKRILTIHEYLLYIMSPFVYEEDMEDFCTDLLRFAMDHTYRPENEWKRFKAKLNSFDVRHLLWSIAVRMGLGKGKLFSNEDCACYIECRFPCLCVTASGEPLSHNTLKNLTVTSNSDQIHCDNPGTDGLMFHIPSQLGVQ